MSWLTVLGAGSWGTALACVLAPRFERVWLWARDEESAQRMQATRRNDAYLPAVTLPENIEVISDFQQGQGANFIIGAMPSSYADQVWWEVAPLMLDDPESGQVLISATKGFDPLHLRRVSQVVEHHRPADGPPVAVLSGPNFAEEVALGEPTLSVIACEDATTATRIQQAFHTNTFRLYTTTDTVGVEVGGALKNVVALAAGVIHGLGLGNNTQAALMTRGLAEITRLAIAMGAQPATLAGLAGLGDLVLTCTGGLSRNRRAGILLAEGQTKEQVIASTRMVAEGINSTYAACALAEQYNVDMPIAQQMRRILDGELPPREAVRQLMERAPKGE